MMSSSDSFAGRMCGVHKASALLVFIGAVNWGLVGGFDFNLVEYLLGNWSGVVRLVYILVGIAALMLLGAEHCCMKEGACSCGKCEACRAGMGKESVVPPSGSSAGMTA